jgi:hypothetical protein
MIHRGQLEELLSARLGQRALLERLLHLEPDHPIWAQQLAAVQARIADLENALRPAAEAAA